MLRSTPHSIRSSAVTTVIRCLRAAVFGVNDARFGHEVMPGIYTEIDRYTGSNTLLFGALPFQALGLSDSYAADCWGNKLSYVVTESLTSTSMTDGFPSNATGGIEIRTGTLAASTALLSNAAYAVISHGEDGYGAVAKNYSDAADHRWKNALTSAIDSENSMTSDNRLFVTAYNQNPGSAHFDDVVVYFGKRNSNCNGSNPVTWDINGSSCSATAGQMANGSSKTVASTSALPGQAGFVCTNGVVSADSNVTKTCGTCSAPAHGGAAVCTAGASCAAAAGTPRWGSGNQCYGAFTAAFDGVLSASVTNLASNYAGAAIGLCTNGTWVIQPWRGVCRRALFAGVCQLGKQPLLRCIRLRRRRRRGNTGREHHGGVCRCGHGHLQRRKLEFVQYELCGDGLRCYVAR